MTLDSRIWRRSLVRAFFASARGCNSDGDHPGSMALGICPRTGSSNGLFTSVSVTDLDGAENLSDVTFHLWFFTPVRILGLDGARNVSETVSSSGSSRS